VPEVTLKETSQIILLIKKINITPPQRKQEFKNFSLGASLHIYLNKIIRPPKKIKNMI